MPSVTNPYFQPEPDDDQLLADKYFKVFDDHFSSNPYISAFDFTELTPLIAPEDLAVWNDNVTQLIADRLGATIIP